MRYIVIIGIILTAFQARGQRYPVWATTQLTPPYSVYLSDYTVPGTDLLIVNLLLQDVNEPAYNVRLHFRLEGAGIRIETKPQVSLPPIILEGGVPTLLTAADLEPYLSPENLQFSGISREAYQQAGALPDGFYQFCFTVTDYRRPDVVLSNESCAQAWLVLNDPPRINQPFCGTTVPLTDPQNIFFQWLPMQTGSPNAALTTEYELALYEWRPAGRDPNEVVRTQPPILLTTTDATSYAYGVMDPALIPGQAYVFRVRARDLGGKDRYKNDGYSEVCTFTFGDVTPLLPPDGLTATSGEHGNAHITWETVATATDYELAYREAKDSPWYYVTTDATQTQLQDLKPETDYEIQVVSRLDAFRSNPSGLVVFHTLPARQFSCSDVYGVAIPENQQPLPTAMAGDVVQVGTFDMEVLDITGHDGVFSGWGAVKIPYLGTRINCRFTNLHINVLYQVYSGEVRALTTGEEGLREQWQPNENDDEGEALPENIDDPVTVVIDHEGVIDSVYVVEETGVIVVINEDGTQTNYEQPVNEQSGEKETVGVRDEHGNVWTVDKDGNVTPPGQQGGPQILPPGQPVDYWVEFTSVAHQAYGFDNYFNDEPADQYSVEQRQGQSYPIPWKSIARGATDVVSVGVPGAAEFPSAIQFKISTGKVTLDTVGDAGQRNLTLTDVSRDAMLEAYVLQADEINSVHEITLGKLQIAAYEKIRKKVILVPVNGVAIPSVNDFTTALNSIYQQAVCEWDVQVDDAFYVDDSFLQGLDEDVDEKSPYAAYNSNMRSLNNEYKRSHQIDPQAAYLFFVGGGNTRLTGFMPFTKTFGYVFTDKPQDVVHTAAHELGHGIFYLLHTFEPMEFIAPEGQTKNLMDYTADTQLSKRQWDFIHAPTLWWERDADGEVSTPASESGQGKEVGDSPEFVLELVRGYQCAVSHGDSLFSFYFHEGMTSGLTNLTYAFSSIEDKGLLENITIKSIAVSPASYGEKTFSVDKLALVVKDTTETVYTPAAPVPISEKVEVTNYYVTLSSGEADIKIQLGTRDDADALMDLFHLSPKDGFSSYVATKIDKVMTYLFGNDIGDLCDVLRAAPICLYENLETSQRIAIVNGIINSLSTDAYQEAIIIKILEAVPTEIKASFARALQAQVDIKKLNEAIDNTSNRKRLMRAYLLLSYALHEVQPGIASQELAVSYHFNLNSGRFSLTRSGEGALHFILTVDEYYEFMNEPVQLCVLQPFDLVTLTTARAHEELSVGGNIQLPAVPAAVVALLIQKQHSDDFYTALQISMDVALLVVGVGELSLAIKAYKASKTALTMFRLSLAIADNSTALADLVCTLEETKDTDLCKRWGEISFYVGMGMLTVNLADVAVEHLPKLLDESGTLRLARSADVGGLQDLLEKVDYFDEAARKDFIDDLLASADLVAAMREDDRLIDVWAKLHHAGIASGRTDPSLLKKLARLCR